MAVHKATLPSLRHLGDFGMRSDMLEAFNKEADLVDVWKTTTLAAARKEIGILTWVKKLKDRTQAQGKNLYDHIFVGKTGGTNGITGVHHKNALTTKTSGFVNGDIRIKPGTINPKASGFYEAEIEYFNGSNWITKTENGVPVKNGFFPDSWTPDQIMEEIALASSKITSSNYVAATKNSFEQVLSTGQKVRFYMGSNQYIVGNNLPNYIISVFPVF